MLAVADRLGAGIVTALLGKGAVPGDVPYHTQQLGLLGSQPSYDMMQDCDTLLMVGTNFPYSEFLPPTGQARGVQIDLLPRHLSLRYPMEVNLWGDAKTTLAALLPLLDDQRTAAGSRASPTACPSGTRCSRPRRRRQRIRSTRASPFHLLNERLPDDAIVTADAGTTADWYGNHISLGRNMMGNLSGRLATMLASMPYAIAAKFAFPERPVVCTIGDGAFQMLGMNGLITVKRHWQEWANPTFVVLVLHNNDLNQVHGRCAKPATPATTPASCSRTSTMPRTRSSWGCREFGSTPRGPCRSVGCRLRCRSSGRARRGDRQERAAAAGPHHVRPGEGRRPGPARRRPRRRQGDQPQRPVGRVAALRQAAPRRRRRVTAVSAQLIDRVDVGAYTIPTPEPESDGTLIWDATTIVVVELGAGDVSGIGYAYTAPAAASVVRETLASVVTGTDVLANGSTWMAMVRSVRNLGRPGIASSAIAAVDIALWDLKAKVLGISVADALGRFHAEIPAYGSGGFTSLTDAELAAQLEGWVAQGLRAVKMKVGREPAGTRRASPWHGRDRRRRGLVRRRQRRVYAQAGARARRPVRRARRDVVRGAGELR